MLVLGRKKQETITIILPNTDDIIEITVVEINGYFIRLGIEAPSNIKIVRSELLERNSEGR